LAASKTSLGNPRKLCRIKNVPNATEAPGSTIAW
jgi:hypothetical protein